MADNPSDVLGELQSSELKSSAPLSLSRFNKRTNKTTKLIDNGDPSNFLKGQNREYFFELKEQTFISYIAVHVEGYSQFDSVMFNWTNIVGKENSKKVSKSSRGEYFVVTINDIIGSFSFKPPKKYFFDTQLKMVNVTGLTLSEFNIALGDVGKVDAYKSKIVELCEKKIEEADHAQQKLDDLTEEKQGLISDISQFNSQKSTIESSITDLSKTRDEIQNTINQKITKEGEVASRLDSLNDTIDTKLKESQSLNQQIINEKRTLSQLESDINLFPTEIRAFVKQGAQNIGRYTILAFLPICALIYVTVYLFDNAANFAVIYSSAPSSDIFSVFLSRIPFVVVSLGIISASYKIAQVFIAEVIKINTQRLNLSKISIIAKDVSESSESGLELSETHRAELRTKLKMDLLRSHLKGYIEDGYTYQLDVSRYEEEVDVSEEEASEDEK